MRIVLVLPSLSDSAHSAVAMALRKECTKLGNEVFIFAECGGVALSLRGGRETDEAISEIASLPSVARNDDVLTHDRRRLSKTALQLRQLLDDEKVDVCHVQHFSRGLQYLEVVRFPERTSLILTHQGASLEFLDHPNVFQRLAERADCVTTVSQQALNELNNWIPSVRSKSSVIHNGVDLEVKLPVPVLSETSFIPNCEQKPVPKENRYRTSDRFVLSVGRLAAYKGMDLLSVAFGRLLVEDQDLHLIICGPDQTKGQFSDFIQKLGLAKRIHLLGNVDYPTVQYLLQECLFFVLASRHENLPMALLEAMAASKAVIAASVGGVPEVITNEENGLLVEPKDPEGLFIAMRRLVKEPLLRKRLGEEAKETVKKFGWPSIAKEYLEVYRQVLSRKPR